MEWEKIHELEDFSEAELTDEQKKYLAIAANLDPMQFIFHEAKFNAADGEKLSEKITCVSKLAEYLQEHYADTLSLELPDEH